MRQCSRHLGWMGLIGTVGLGGLLGWSAASAQPVCNVAALVGEAHSAAHVLALGDGLEAGAEIRTGPGSRVRLHCADGSSLVLGDNSQLTLTRYTPASAGQPRAVSLWLQLGVLGQKVTPGGSGGTWEVHTPSAVTAVRGTEFVVEVSNEQGTAVHVDEGVVAVESTAKTRGLVPHPPTQLTTQSDGTQCSPTAGCSEAKRWSDERVRALQDRLGGV